MNQYNYFNLKGSPGIVVIFMADSITEADKLFESMFGKHPAKLPHIVVRWYMSGLL